VLSDERTRRDYDEGSDVVLQGRDEAGGLREQVGREIQPHPYARHEALAVALCIQAATLR